MQGFLVKGPVIIYNVLESDNRIHNRADNYFPIKVNTLLKISLFRIQESVIMVSETVIHIQTVLLKQGKFVLNIIARCMEEPAIFYIVFRDEEGIALASCFSDQA